jgi:4-hydroxy-3-methylbut-2-enyl diphosphate reductase
MIGHKGHPEVEGHHGPARQRHSSGGGRGRRRPGTPLQTEKLAVVTQTTLRVWTTPPKSRAVKARFPHVRAQATGHLLRHKIARTRSGAQPRSTSSLWWRQPDQLNSNQLRAGCWLGTEAYMVDDASELSKGPGLKARSGGPDSRALGPDSRQAGD